MKHHLGTTQQDYTTAMQLTYHNFKSQLILFGMPLFQEAKIQGFILKTVQIL